MDTQPVPLSMADIVQGMLRLLLSPPLMVIDPHRIIVRHHITGQFHTQDPTTVIAMDTARGIAVKL